MKKILVLLLVSLFMFPMSGFANSTSFASFYILKEYNSDKLLGITKYSDGTYGLFNLEYGIGCGISDKEGKNVYVSYETFLDGGINNNLYVPETYGDGFDTCKLWDTEEIAQFNNLTWLK